MPKLFHEPTRKNVRDGVIQALRGCDVIPEKVQTLLSSYLAGPVLKIVIFWTVEERRHQPVDRMSHEGEVVTSPPKLFECVSANQGRHQGHV